MESTGTGIVSTLVNSLSEMLTGSVEAISKGFNSLFFTTDGNLSTLGNFMIIFVGIGCAISLVWIIINIFKRK